MTDDYAGDHADDNVMHDSPAEVMAQLANSGGDCSAQSVLPVEGGYACHCACGNWDVVAPTQEDGLRLAREHTRTTLGF